MKVELTEETNYEEYEDYVEPVKVKQSDDISAEVEDENNLDVNTMVSKLFVFEFFTVKAAQEVTVSHDKLLICCL